VFLKLFIEKRVLYACAIATASLIMASLGITGLVLISMAASDGLTVLFGHRWAGELVTGAILLLFTTIAGLVIFRGRAQETEEANKAEQKLDWWVETIRWAKAHPEVTLGAAALMGFIVATLISRPRRAEHVEQPFGPSPAEPSKSRRSGSYLAFLTELFALARPFITAFVASHLGAKTPEPSHNGGHTSSAQPSPAPAREPDPKPYERQST
jgi:hypothetical protein